MLALVEASVHGPQGDDAVLDGGLAVRGLEHFALPEGGVEEAAQLGDRVGCEEGEAGFFFRRGEGEGWSEGEREWGVAAEGAEGGSRAE